MVTSSDAAGEPAGRRPPPDPHDLLVEQRPVRLNRFLAAAGVASRRAAERLIEAGRVSVNRKVVTHPGAQVTPDRDRVSLDGETVTIRAVPRYLLLHKPRGVLSTVSDPYGRPTVLDLLRPNDRARRLYPVGRLDLASEGLVLLTDDGTLAQRLLHPRYHVRKRYRVWTEPTPPALTLRSLARGVCIAPGLRTRPARVWPRGSSGFEIELGEGRKRQIRLMCESVGLGVTRLVRVAFGPLTIEQLRPGRYRPLRTDEVHALWRAAGLERRPPAAGPA